ncbi:MAG: hypothetical protein ACMUIU_07280 [bacterium]
MFYFIMGVFIIAIIATFIILIRLMISSEDQKEPIEPKNEQQQEDNIEEDVFQAGVANKCPCCDSENLELNPKCDCGYDFTTEKVQEPYIKFDALINIDNLKNVKLREDYNNIDSSKCLIIKCKKCGNKNTYCITSKEDICKIPLTAGVRIIKRLMPGTLLPLIVTLFISTILAKLRLKPTRLKTAFLAELLDAGFLMLDTG